MPNELPPLAPRPDADSGGLPPLSARHDEPTHVADRLPELPTRPLPPTREFPPDAATAPLPPPRGGATTRPAPPATPTRPARRRPGAAMWAAVVLTSAIAGAGSARLIGDRDGSSTPTVTQTSNRPIATEGVLESAIRSVQSSVVEVRVNSGFGGSQGSGVILQPDGLIVTNNHVIDGAQSGRVEVITASGQRIPAQIVAADADDDLAVLRPASSPGTGVTLVEDTAGPPPAGETVFAIGSPFGLQNTVTSGVVSAYRNDDGRPLIQFDAPVNPGNSGGGLFNLQGQLIGIPTSIRSPVNGNVGIAFAVPATRVRAILARAK